MGEVRSFSKHVRWNPAEVEAIKSLYADGSWVDLFAALPGRSDSQITNKANLLGIHKTKTPAMTVNEVRESKRAHTARRRMGWSDEEREVYKIRMRKYHADNRELHNANWRAMHKRRFFWSRAKKVAPTTAKQLWSLWKQQRDICELTGRVLTRENCQLDHKLPLARGGSNEIGNLRWVCERVNLAKRDMLDEELFQLCREIMARILKVDQLGEEKE